MMRRKVILLITFQKYSDNKEKQTKRKVKWKENIFL